MKFSIKDFFSKCDEILSFRGIWSHLLKKALMKNFFFCVLLIFLSNSVNLVFCTLMAGCRREETSCYFLLIFFFVFVFEFCLLYLVYFLHSHHGFCYWYGRLNKEALLSSCNFIPTCSRIIYSAIDMESFTLLYLVKQMGLHKKQFSRIKIFFKLFLLCISWLNLVPKLFLKLLLA